MRLTGEVAAFRNIYAVIAVAVTVSAQAAGYVEPSLLGRGEGRASVIVTARDSKSAARAVQNVGGRVTSDLWVVDAVAAEIPAGTAVKLGTTPGVVSVVENKKLQPAEWNGWASDLRINKGQYTVNDTLYVPPAHLPNGGFAQISTNGELLIVNPDGSERKRVKLTTGAPFYSPAVASPDGKIFLGAVYGCMYALDTDGRVLWQNASMLNTTYFYAPPVIASDGTVIAVTYYGTTYGFDPNDGSIRWQQSLARTNAEYKTAAILGPDDTMYISSDQGDVFAITSTGGVRWSAALNSGANKYAGATPLLRNGVLYVSAGSRLVAFDAQTGTQRMVFNADATLLGSPAMTPDGTSLIVASANKLYSVSTSGQTQWTATSTNNLFIRPPLVSPDGSSVYIAAETSKGKAVDYLLGFDRSRGTQKWSYQVAATLTCQTVLDPDGGILFAGKDTSIYRVGPDGTETHRIKTHATITDVSQASDGGNIVLRIASAPHLIFAGRMPNAWNGRKDVEPGSSRTKWKLVNPVSVDVGADVLHRKTLAGGSTYIRGANVGVAVIDSGVYWDTETKAILGVQVQHQFQGQADFVDTICPPALTGCVQSGDHAFYDYNTSRDGYGHGTHVAGTIANKLQDEATDAFLGIAPDARILSVRVLGNDGSGTYEQVINGIQYVITNKTRFNVRVMNLSLSAYATVPYFVDPFNRAVERAWQAGIVVLAAAGNTGPFAQTITVPGNDPYVITVGAVSSNRTAGYWRDDIVASWSATGPTFDGFAKPDVVAPGSQIVSYMYNDPTGINTAMLARLHPDYSSTSTLFRMNGTSMATAVASGVVALMLQANPALTPDQVKYRLMDSAQMSLSGHEPVHNTMQQGMGRIWAPDAVLGNFDAAGAANLDLNIAQDLAAGYETLEDLERHYQGPITRQMSDDGSAYVYFATDSSGQNYAFGVTSLDGRWLDADAAARMTWGGSVMNWVGGLSFTGDNSAFAVARMTWGGARMTWGGARMTWGGARMTWGGARMTWGGGLSWRGGEAWGSARMTWGGSVDTYAVARMTWGGSLPGRTSSGSSARWIDDVWRAPASNNLPAPLATQP